MPLTLKKLTGATVAATVDLKIPGQTETEKLALVYRPGVLTGALEEELREYGDRSEGWAALIAKLVVSWELETEPGKSVPLEFIPPTPAKIQNGKIIEAAKPARGALLTVPTWILQGVIEGVKADLRPNAESAETSGASS